MARNNSNGSKTIQSSSSLSDLTDELLVEILCRLGLSKLAIQCKCICKRWCSLIDVNSSRDSYFLCQWRMVNKELPIALLTKRSIIIDCEIPTVKFLDFLPWPSSNNKAPSIDIHAVYKDLVLCSQSSYDHGVYYIRYYICNPFTKQWIVLPPPPPLEFSDCDVNVALFAPDEGSGNDIQKIKVVRVINHGFQPIPLWNGDIVKVEIFSCDDSSGEWKRWNAPQSCIYFFSYHVSYNGMLVWLSAAMNNTFHLTGFKFHTNMIDNINQDIVNYIYLPLPPGFEKKSDFKIGSYKGCLRIAYMDSTHPFDHHKLFIWELNSHTQDWKLVHAIDFSEAKDFAIAKNSNRFLGGCVLAFHPHDRDILYLIIDRLEKYSAALYSDESYWWSCNVREKTANLIRGMFPPIQQECNVFPLQLPSCRPSSVPLLETEKRS